MPDGSVQYRSDTGDQDNKTEQAKSKASDSFKRAAVNFGVGLFLYDIQKVYIDGVANHKGQIVPCDQAGKVLRTNEELTHFINSNKQVTISEKEEAPAMIEKKGGRKKTAPVPQPVTQPEPSPAINDSSPSGAVVDDLPAVSGPTAGGMKPKSDFLEAKKPQRELEYTEECLKTLSTEDDFRAFFALKGKNMDELNIPKVKGKVTLQSALAYFKLEGTPLTPEPEKPEINWPMILEKKASEMSTTERKSAMEILSKEKLTSNDKELINKSYNEFIKPMVSDKNLTIDIVKETLKKAATLHTETLSVMGKRYKQLFLTETFVTYQNKLK
jgi:hypothetical protein